MYLEDMIKNMQSRDTMKVYDVNVKHYTKRGDKEIMQTLRLSIVADDDCLKTGDRIEITDLEKKKSFS